MNKFTSISPRLFDVLAAISLLVAVILGFVLGTESPELPSNLSEAIRVEIHRYMGYEELLIRYLSLPYDLTVNANENIQAIDIGFLPLVFLPILIIWGLKKDWMKWLVMIMSIVLLIISTSTGAFYNNDLEKIGVKSEAFEKLDNSLMVGLYSLSSNIYSSFGSIFNERNAYTYPFLIILFFVFFLIAKERMKDVKGSQKGFLVFALTYGFLFFLLSAGIIWYGFLAFPLLLMSIVWSFSKKDKTADFPQKILHYGFLFSIGIFIILGFTQRLSSISLSVLKIDQLKGKRLYDPSMLKYQTGEYDEDRVTQGFFPKIVPAFKQINQETESLIFKAGGRYNFFVEKNDKRIFPDDQLALFQIIIDKYQSKSEIVELFKKSGFKYLMIDLLLPTLDNSPEKALVKKFENLLKFIYQNPQLELLGTDRTLRVQNNGQQQTVNGIFGEIQNYGTYAIFEIK